MNRLHERANDGRNGFAIGLKNAQSHRRADRIFMPRRIAATMQIEADSRRFFLKGKPGLGLRQHDERNVAIHARTAASFQAGKRMKMLWGSS